MAKHDEFSLFVIIVHILINESTNLVFICEPLVTVYLNEHIFAYEVQYAQDQSVVFFDDMDIKVTHKFINRNSKYYISVF